MGTSMGATLHMYYCMGKFSGWRLSIIESAFCPECGMEKALVKTKSCCSDEQRIIKTTTDQKASESSFQAIYSIAAAIPSDFVDAPANHIISLTEATPLTNGPPQASSVAIYIRNGVFRI